VISAIGGEALAGGMSISWTMGESAVATATAGSVLLTQGFQQPPDFVNSIHSVSSSDIKVYPNPSSGLLRLSMGALSGNFLVLVRDAAGRDVYRSSMQALGFDRELDLNALPGGYYSLEIRGENAASSYASKFHIIK
jgi:hypothetical protein